jgi:hypothetical protein
MKAGVDMGGSLETLSLESRPVLIGKASTIYTTGMEIYHARFGEPSSTGMDIVTPVQASNQSEQRPTRGVPQLAQTSSRARSEKQMRS